MTAPLPLVPPPGCTGPPQYLCQGWTGFSELLDGIRSRASNGAPWPGSENPGAYAVEDGILTMGLGANLSTYGVFQTPPDKPSVVRIVAMQADGHAGGWGAMWALGGPGAPPMPRDLGEIDINETGMINRTSYSGKFLGSSHPNAYAATTFRPQGYEGRGTPQYPYGYNANLDLSKTWQYWDLIYDPGVQVWTKLANQTMGHWTPTSAPPGPFPTFPYSLIFSVGRIQQTMNASWHTIGPAIGVTMKIASIGVWW